MKRFKKFEIKIQKKIVGGGNGMGWSATEWVSGDLSQGGSDVINNDSGEIRYWQ